MGKFVLHNVRLFAGGADLTSVNNKVELTADLEDQDVTNFASTDGTRAWKEVLAGLAKTKLMAEGQWEAGSLANVDNESWASNGLVTAWTVGPNGAAVGDLAWVVNALRSSYKLGGKVGDVAPWEADAIGTAPLARGVIAHPPGTARTADGTGTAINLGAVAADQRLYANLHVLSVAGTSSPTITARIESDTAVGFPSPVTQLTFAAKTAIGQQAASVPGAIADTWWRAAWTITGTNPSFLFVVSFGIK